MTTYNRNNLVTTPDIYSGEVLKLDNEYGKINIDNLDIDKLWEKMYNNAIKMWLNCPWCNSANAIGSPTCCQCGGAMGEAYKPENIRKNKIWNKTRKEIINEYLSLSNEELDSVSPEKMIKVVSLTPYKLNIYSKFDKKIFGFENIGKIQIIQYKELIDIISNTHSFAEKGYYLIMDKNVVRIHGLKPYYDGITKQEEFEE